MFISVIIISVIKLKCLIIIDLQAGFISNDNIEKIINPIKKVRKLFLPEYCVFTQFINNKNSLFVRTLNWNKLLNTDEQKIVLDINDKNLIVKKSTYNAVNQEFILYLKQNNINKAYLCGVDIDSCVLATAFNLFDLGIEPVIISDCCSTNSEVIQIDSILKIAKRSFGEKSVIESKQLLIGG